MTGTVAYILARKIALGAVSGIKNLSFSGNQIIFNFNDGSSATMTVPLPKDGTDGVSVVNLEIDANKHLICTMSDGSTIDAGEIPGETGGGLIQVKNKAALPTDGTDNTLYLTKNDDTLYYWDDEDKLYRTITSGSGANGIDFKTSSNIEFDGIKITFDLPIDDKKISIYINGMYLTEGEDYTIDRTISPNTVTFEEVWEETDLCTVVWVNGTVDQIGSISDNVGLAQLGTDVQSVFNAAAYILTSSISDPWPSTFATINGADVRNVSTILEKQLVKVLYVIDDSDKIVGCGNVITYDDNFDKFTVVLTKYSENGVSLAKKEDIDQLFTNIPNIDTANPILATKGDIDNLFNNIGDIDTSKNVYSKIEDINKLFIDSSI